MFLQYTLDMQLFKGDVEPVCEPSNVVSRRPALPLCGLPAGFGVWGWAAEARGRTSPSPVSVTDPHPSAPKG